MPDQISGLERIPGTDTCPECDGLFLVNPFQQRSEVDCMMCGGTGMIDPTKVCYCGRPGRFLLENSPVCGLLECMKTVFRSVL